MKNLIITLSVVCLTVATAHSQDSTAVENSSVTNISDNLGRTLSSRAIYKGTMLTGVGFSSFKSDYKDQDYYIKGNGIAIPSLNIGYGVSKNVDIRIGTSFFKTEFEYNDSTGIHKSEYQGLSGLSLGSKVNLFKQNKWIPELAFSLNANILNQNFKFTEDMILNSTLSIGYYLGENFRVGGNLVMRNYFNQSYQDKVSTYFSYTLNVRYELKNGLGMYADVAAGSFRFTSFHPNVGVYYRLNNNMQIQMSAGKHYINVVDYYDERYLSAGFNWLLFNN